jgi:thiamine pyrophosphate-dependent acetolactate synthase large subunit-like protein
VDSNLQEEWIQDRSRLRVPAVSIPAPPVGEIGAVREAARLLVNAQNPQIQIAKLGRTPKAFDLMIELAELLQAPVAVGGYGSWKDFPNNHPLDGNGGPGYRPDVVLGL